MFEKSIGETPMAKKARKKASKKSPKKKSRPVTKRKKRRAAKRKGFAGKVSGAYRAVVDTVKGTGRLRNRLEQPGTSETE
jgi:hypothetical protein